MVEGVSEESMRIYELSSEYITISLRIRPKVRGAFAIFFELSLYLHGFWLTKFIVRNVDRSLLCQTFLKLFSFSLTLFPNGFRFEFLRAKKFS